MDTGAITAIASSFFAAVTAVVAGLLARPKHSKDDMEDLEEAQHDVSALARTLRATNKILRDNHMEDKILDWPNLKGPIQ